MVTVILSRAARKTRGSRRSSEAVLPAYVRGRRPDQDGSKKIERPEYVPGKLIVRFKEEAVRPAAARSRHAAVRSIAAALPETVINPLECLGEDVGVKSVEPLFAPEAPQRPTATRAAPTRSAMSVVESVRDPKRKELRGFTVVELESDRDAEKAIRKLRASPAVSLVERVPNRWLAVRRHPAASDPSFTLQWGLWAIEWAAAARVSARKIHVAVLDTGIDANHPDLKGAIESYTHTGNSARDFDGHGSHVAGIVAATSSNGVGITGIADARLHIYKVFDDPRGRSKELPYNDVAFNRALADILDSDIKIVNLSLGGPESSETERLLFQSLRNEGKLVIAAMGNEFEDGNPIGYPAAYKSVVAVGAIDDRMLRASFSNTGKHIAVSAPGEGILSTIPLQPFPPERRQTEYIAWGGTSMAPPHVAGLAALIWAKHPKKNVNWIASRINRTAKKLAAMRGKSFTPAFGHGLVNARAALGR